MGDAHEDRAQAAQLPEGDIIRLLLEQHAEIKDLFATIPTVSGTDKAQLFAELRTLLAVHETAEEMILRPVVKSVVGEQEAEARNDEELEANKVLLELEKLNVDSPDFDQRLKAFQEAVDHHAEMEESQEFPGIVRDVDADQRQLMGQRFKMTEKIAPTHPHPKAAESMSKEVLATPFLSVVDRVRDLLGAK